jgi:hypothetical protein
VSPFLKKISRVRALAHNILAARSMATEQDTFMAFVFFLLCFIPLLM